MPAGAGEQIIAKYGLEGAIPSSSPSTSPMHLVYFGKVLKMDEEAVDNIVDKLDNLQYASAINKSTFDKEGRSARWSVSLDCRHVTVDTKLTAAPPQISRWSVCLELAARERPHVWSF